MITIEARHFTLPEDARTTIEEKLLKATRMVRPTAVHVILDKGTHHNKGGIYQCEIHLHLPKKIVKARITDGEDVASSINRVLEKIGKQIEKYKARRKRA